MHIPISYPNIQERYASRKDFRDRYPLSVWGIVCKNFSYGSTAENRIGGSIGFGNLENLIICATFVTYFLIPVAQKRIRPTIISMYSYVQPIIAISISIAIGMDVLIWQKVLAAVMVFGDVIIVSFSKSASR